MRIPPHVALLAALALVAGCSRDVPLAPTDSTGRLDFAMSLAPAREAGITVTRVTARLTHLDRAIADSLDLAIAPDGLSASGTIDGLIPGSWRVEVNLYDAGETLIAAGSDTITVVSGHVTEAAIVIAFTGGAHITVTWGSTPEGAWDDFGQGEGLDGAVLAIGEFNGELIAAGDFHHAGGIAAENIARFDGAAWHPLGAGLGGRVFRLARYQGRLIASGDFHDAGGAPAVGVAAWDGASWHALGSGLAGDGYQGPWGNSLTTFGEALIVGGAFNQAGGQAANYIASWNGASWSGMGSGMSGVSNPHVIALDIWNGTVVAGGWFLYAGGAYVNRIATWNGTGWNPVGAGMNSCVLDLAVDGPTLYAIGDFTSPSAYCAVMTAPGGAWAPMGAGFDANMWGAAIYHGRLHAGGAAVYSGSTRINHVASWNGSGWDALGGGVTGGTISDLYVFGDALYAGGTFTHAGGIPVGHVARWRD